MLRSERYLTDLVQLLTASISVFLLSFTQAEHNFQTSSQESPLGIDTFVLVSPSLRRLQRMLGSLQAGL